MIAQRGHGVEAKAAAKAPKPAAEPTPSAGPPPAAPLRRAKRLSFKEDHALKTLPSRMEAAHSEIAGLQARLADPDLFARDRAAFDTASGRLPLAQAELAAMEEEWLTLEMRREELEG